MKKKYYIFSFFLTVFTLLGSVAQADSSCHSLDWYNRNWKNRMMIEIKPNQFKSPLSNFPVYINLHSVNSKFFKELNEDCSDIRITSVDSQTELPREIISCDTLARSAQLQFIAKNISSTTTTKFFIYYNNPRASEPTENSQYGKNAVWDTLFKGVWHLQEKGGNRFDSSINHNTLIDNNRVGSALGKFGTAADFHSTNSEYLSITDVDQQGLDISPQITVSAWVKSRLPNLQTIVSKYNQPTGQSWLVGMIPDPENLYLSSFYSASGNTFVATPGIKLPFSLSTSSWSHIVWKIDATTQTGTYYLNGNKVGQAQDMQGITSIYDTNAPFNIGRRADGEWQFDGLIQEVRVFGGLLSDNWIKAEYRNQNNPDDFYSIKSSKSCQTHSD